MVEGGGYIFILKTLTSQKNPQNIENYEIPPSPRDNFHPIYKNKGITMPEKSRPITILSCMGKLFTCILSKRLNKYADQQDIFNI